MASSLSGLHDRTQTHYTRYDSCGRVISPTQRPLPDNTQHSPETNIHVPVGIRTHDLNSRAAADLRLRPRGYWDRFVVYIYWSISYEIVLRHVPEESDFGIQHCLGPYTRASRHSVSECYICITTDFTAASSIGYSYPLKGVFRLNSR